MFSLSCAQGGFIAEGVDSGSKFLDVNLTEKVIDKSSKTENGIDKDILNKTSSC